MNILYFALWKKVLSSSLYSAFLVTYASYFVSDYALKYIPRWPFWQRLL